MTTWYAASTGATEPSDHPSAGGLIALQALYVLFLPVWFLVAVVSVMGAADPNASGALVAVVLSVVWAYPVVLLVAVVGAWVARSRGAARAAWVLNLLPLPWVLACAALMAYAAFS
jgi:hypothetical protein